MQIEWETPQKFFDSLDNEFHFTTDVCANISNAKCLSYFNARMDALKQQWVGVCWMNPPYIKTYEWVQKAYEAAQNGTTVVCLLRTSVDTKWFHEFCMKATEIRFVIDRIHFGKNGIFKRANHPSMVVVFRPYCTGPPQISSIPNKK